LPAKLPDLGIKKGLTGWSSRWTSTSSRHDHEPDSEYGLDDEPYAAGEKNDVFEDVGAIVHPDDPLADAPIGAPVERVGHGRYEEVLSAEDDVPKEGIDEPYFHASNGYLILPDHEKLAASPLPRHPMLDLIDRAEQEWDAKVKRQSKSLEDAVKEYRRRYHRRPPKGFDKWWDYAQAHNVVLVDEYDQIFKDLQPFWALCVLPSSVTWAERPVDRRKTSSIALAS
jgi:hypothetical protein